MNISTYISNNFILFMCIILWLYILSVLKRSNLVYQRFIVGSVGLFSILLLYLKPRITVYLAKLITLLAGLIGNVFSSFSSYPRYGMIFIDSTKGAISLYVDYECAGLIEILVFISLVLFFPLFKTLEKLWISLFGTIYIIFSNIIRILSICFILYKYGPTSYYIAHTVVGRLLFYLLSIFLYFVIFTRKQINQQKVGNFNYDTNIKN